MLVMVFVFCLLVMVMVCDVIVRFYSFVQPAPCLVFLRPSDLALNEAVGARLGGIDLGVLAGVLVALVPAEV
jgi:hypothetical protein